MKTLTIGDIHGESNWIDIEDINQLINENNIKPIYDKYIFLGDYVDAFHKTNVRILKNLLKIIKFKKKYPENIILLWGNHDIQYLLDYNKYGCTGYRPTMQYDLHDIFKENNSLFQFSFQIDDTIWTHAGISNWWYENKYIPYFNSEENKKFNILDEDNTLSKNLNNLFFHESNILFNVGKSRGGWNKTGGPLWCDKNELITDPLNHFNQIVGHTTIENIKIYKNKYDNNLELVFCDCLQNTTNCYIKEF